MTKFFSLLLIMIAPVICQANPLSEQEMDQLIIFHTFSGDVEKADSLIETQISKTPGNPKYYTVKGVYYFYTRYYNQGAADNDILLEKMIQSASKAIEIGEEKDMTLEDKFYVGTAYGYMSRYYGMQRSFWNAFWAARSCRRYLNEVLEADPSYTDAKIGLAVINYFSATRIRGFWHFIAWIVGMSGDHDKALQQFQEVADNGYWFKYEAQFILAALYRFYENDILQAKRINDQLYEKFPQNPWIRAQYDQLRFLVIVNKRGVDFFDSAFDSLFTTYQVTNAGVLNNFGYTLINQNRIGEAIEVFKINIRLFPDVANGYDSLSEAYVLAGNREMAIHYSQRCLDKIWSDSTINETLRNNLREISEKRLEALGVVSDKLNI